MSGNFSAAISLLNRRLNETLQGDLPSPCRILHYISPCDPMTSRVQSMSGSSALQAPEALGWGWMTEAQSVARPVPPEWGKGLIRALVATAGAVLIAALAGFIAFVASLDRSERDPASRTDAIVALTGGAQRIGDAIDLLAKGYGNRLLITGVNERTSRDEIARLNPGQRRLFDCCVDLDYRARNTIGNAIETRRWMESHRFRSLIVVTSNYHMPRTLVELDNAIPAARKVPYAVVGDLADSAMWWRPQTLRLLVVEYLKFVVGWARTRIETDSEQSPTMALIGREPVKAGPQEQVAAAPSVR
jgi:uncharacterized SAM-binding protein YcdF (DUF218 family)